jgi:hypothetical protein
MKRSAAARKLRKLWEPVPLDNLGDMRTIDRYRAELFAVIEGLEKPRKVRTVTPRGVVVALYIDSHPATVTVNPPFLGTEAVALVYNNVVLAGEDWSPGPIFLDASKGEHLVLKVRGL